MLFKPGFRKKLLEECREQGVDVETCKKIVKEIERQIANDIKQAIEKIVRGYGNAS